MFQGFEAKYQPVPPVALVRTAPLKICQSKATQPNFNRPPAVYWQ